MQERAAAKLNAISHEWLQTGKASRWKASKRFPEVQLAKKSCTI
jgi:hypothetical protein